MYADYEYYTETFYGDLVPEESFVKYASRASDYIDYMTWNKAASVDTDADEYAAIQKCCCALAEQLLNIDTIRAAAAAKTTEEGIIASETVGSHSRSFRSGSDGTQAVQAEQAELANIVRRYLMPTGLLYRGGVAIVHSAYSYTV